MGKMQTTKGVTKYTLSIKDRLNVAG